MSVCYCEDEMTRDRSLRVKNSLTGRLGTSNSKLFRRPLLLPSCCCHCVFINCSCFLCVRKILKSFPSQISSICSISKLLCCLFMIFLSFRKLTGLLCLVCSLLFHSGVAEWSFLGVTGVVYLRKATC